MRSSRCRCCCPIRRIAAARTQLALARDEVCYVGQPVAVVIADTRYIAEDAAAALIVHYEVLPAAARLPRRGRGRRAARAQRSRSNIAATFRLPMATSTSAFAGAAHVFAKSSGSIAAAAWRWRPAPCSRSHDPVSDLLTVWSGTQTPHLGRGTLADLLGRDLEASA